MTERSNTLGASYLMGTVSNVCRGQGRRRWCGDWVSLRQVKGFTRTDLAGSAKASALTLHSRRNRTPGSTSPGFIDLLANLGETRTSKNCRQALQQPGPRLPESRVSEITNLSQIWPFRKARKTCFFGLRRGQILLKFRVFRDPWIWQARCRTMKVSPTSDFSGFFQFFVFFRVFFGLKTESKPARSDFFGKSQKTRKVEKSKKVTFFGLRN